MGNTSNANTAQRAIQERIKTQIAVAQELAGKNQYAEAIQQLATAQSVYTEGFDAAELLRNSSSRKSKPSILRTESMKRTDAQILVNAEDIAKETTALYESLTGLIEQYEAKLPTTDDADVLAEKARADALAEKARTDALAEKARADALAEKARTDALAEKARAGALAEKARTDALAEKARADALAEKARTDALAEKARADALAETARLELEATPEWQEQEKDRLDELARQEAIRAAEEAANILQANYTSTLDAINSLQPVPSIESHVKKLIAHVETLKTTKGLNSELTNALLATYSLLTDEKPDFNAYKTLGNTMQGRPSVGLNILGGLMIALGVAAAALAASGLGLIIIASAAVLSAGALTGGGVSLFFARRQGTSKEMHEIAVEKAKLIKAANELTNATEAHPEEEKKANAM